MKKILFLSVILSLISSCNGQEKKEVKSTTHASKQATKRETIQLDKIALNQSIDNILKGFHLTKDDNHNMTYNLNLDYEEFSFSPDNDFKFNDLNIGKVNSLIIYYLKNNNAAFVYELELENNSNSDSLISEFNKNFGKTTFYKKLENTKQHPIFLDENGEQETRHLTEELIKWKDDRNDLTYFVTFRKNLESKENKLHVIAISNSNKKFDEWFDFRGLDMAFPKK